MQQGLKRKTMEYPTLDAPPSQGPKLAPVVLADRGESTEPLSSDSEAEATGRKGPRPSDAYCRQDLDQNGLNFEMNLASFNRDLVNLVEDLKLRWDLKTAERLRDIAENNPGAVVKVGAVPVFVKMLGEGGARHKTCAAIAIGRCAKGEENIRQIIGCGAVPSLINLLRDGGVMASQEAVSTLITLVKQDPLNPTNHSNITTIVHAGAVTSLLSTMTSRVRRKKKKKETDWVEQRGENNTPYWFSESLGEGTWEEPSEIKAERRAEVLKCQDLNSIACLLNALAVGPNMHSVLA
eukprot:TRINITY_DN12222_c0_g1_i2.p1 TRINITY_DN12222_c0_g1~~TRINITY_DN12222_c0_g1_i2.p1  ORF type:complete len:294 (-),score=79.82 TRINITY_DN12222_c0_g1_i2:152-1033(-)